MASGTAKTRPLLLSASHEYAPASSNRALLIVRTPFPFSFVITHRGSSHTWPQFNRQLMNGAGKPPASHSMRIVRPR